MIPPFAQIDFEVTNRCNAKCHFCPRDMTPHQGLMSPEVFDAALQRAIEFREVFATKFDLEIRLALCGLGEPLLNRHVTDFARAVVDADFFCSVSTNGALLDEARGRELLDAGVAQVDINVGEIDDDYEEIYKLPFERTRANVVRFAEMSGDDCRAQVVLVNHRGDPGHMTRMVDYWKAAGIRHFLPFEIMNRGGAYLVDEMQYDAFPESAEAEAVFEELGVEPVCPVPFIFQFVGYDGQHYLCCSDWTKQTPMGTVFDIGFVDVMAAKFGHAVSREPVCRSCNHDQINRVTADLRMLHAGTGTQDQVDNTIRDALVNDEFARTILARMGVDVTAIPPADAPAARIPLRIV